MSENGKSSGFILTRDEYNEGMSEMVANVVDVMGVVNELRRVLNLQAEILGCHRFILERFVPKPMLEAAATEYSKLRNDQILAERTQSEKPAN